VFSEADFLPGLIVDRYNDLLSLQVLTQAMDTERGAARSSFLNLSDQLKPAAIAERVDPRVRELEQPARHASSSLLHGEKD
jgi:23S rRNA (cytosine1962-C5)-methyltransferase